MRAAILVVALAACAAPALVEPEPVQCITYVVTEYGDTIPFIDLAVPVENMAAVVDSWTEGCP